MLKDYKKEFEKLEQSIRNEIEMLEMMNRALRKSIADYGERIAKLRDFLGENEKSLFHKPKAEGK